MVLSHFIATLFVLALDVSETQLQERSVLFSQSLLSMYKENKGWLSAFTRAPAAITAIVASVI